jgi:antitoxin component YwqK of YwqJK toxin-antitoxin module
MRSIALLIIFLSLFVSKGISQYKQFKISPNGDTLNAIDKKGMKQGKWVTSVPELRGEPGYDEEGIYKDDKKEGTWRKYTTGGDIVAIENYRFGGKDGLQQYFTFLGQPIRDEQWHSYDPKSPYDTIPVYGVGNDEIVSYKYVKATQYSVPDGQWTYYDENGNVAKTETYYRGLLQKNNDDKIADTTNTAVAKDTSKVKPPEVIEYEKKLSKKKRAALSRTGETNL